MSGPDTPESLAWRLREETSALRADPFLGSRVLERARVRAELERPALVVVAFAASLALWLSLQADAPAMSESLDALEAAEASL
jgi:hypothetical protein